MLNKLKTVVIYDKWLSGLGGGEVVACTMARALKTNGYNVLFLSKDFVPAAKIKDKLGIDLSDIAFKQVSSESDLHRASNDYLLSTNHPSTSLRASHSPVSSLRSPIDLFINISFMDYSYGIGKKNVYYVHFPTREKGGGMGGLGIFNKVLQFFQKTNLQSLLPNPLKEKINDRLRAGIYPNLKKRLASYDAFITHSEYVKKWIKKAWNIDAHVLYPPVSLLSTNYQLPTTKNDWICSVGRFFTLGHGKKQEVMIDAFKKLCDQLPTTNYQLHLVGGVGNEPSSLRYIEELQKMAKGYPIFFHFNASRSEVEKVLLTSKIYWHAAGYGEDPEKDPIKFEHFGIAPVEAISAGCIPILFNGGGLKEIADILHLDSNLHLFNTTDELIKNTSVFLKRENDIQNNSIQLLRQHFSQNAFSDNFLSLIKNDGHVNSSSAKF